MAKKKDAGAAPAINIGSHISSTLRCASRSNRRLDWTRFRGSSGWAADAKEGPFATPPYSGHSPMPAGGRYAKLCITAIMQRTELCEACYLYGPVRLRG